MLTRFYRFFSILACAVALLAGPVVAAPAPDAQAVASRFIDAWNQRDAATLTALSDMNADVVTPFGELVPVARLRDYFNDNETAALHLRIDVKGLSVTPHGADAAIATTSYTLPKPMRSRYREDNLTFGTHATCSVTLLRDKDGWKVAQMALPLDEFQNPYVNATARQREWSGTGGLLVGFLLALIFTRRKNQ
jgi:hypothetical protein